MPNASTNLTPWSTGSLATGQVKEEHGWRHGDDEDTSQMAFRAWYVSLHRCAHIGKME